MVIVSAGVVMNVFLAAVGFMVLFLIGFKVPPARVGAVMPGSPAQQADVRVDDVIVYLDGKEMNGDWTKVELGTALADSTQPTPIEVERTEDGKKIHKTLYVTPRRGTGVTKDILRLGISPAYELKTVSGKQLTEEFRKKESELAKMAMPEQLVLKPGDVITAINGKPVKVADFEVFDEAVQSSVGRPLPVTVRGDDGKGEPREVKIQPVFVEPFGDEPLQFAGMLPRVKILEVRETSPAFGFLAPGDVIESITTGKDRNTKYHPSSKEFRDRVAAVGKGGLFDMDVLRGDQPWQITNLSTVELNPYVRGLNVGIGFEDKAVVADTLEGSAGRVGKLPSGARIVRVNGSPAETWPAVREQLLVWLKGHPAPADGNAPPVSVDYVTASGDHQSAQLAVSLAEAKALEGYRYRPNLVLPFEEPHSPPPDEQPREGGRVGRDRDARLHPPVLPDAQTDGDGRHQPQEHDGPPGHLPGRRQLRHQGHRLADLVPGNDQRQPGGRELPPHPHRRRRAVHVPDLREDQGQADVAQGPGHRPVRRPGHAAGDLPVRDLPGRDLVQLPQREVTGNSAGLKPE